MEAPAELISLDQNILTLRAEIQKLKQDVSDKR